MKKIILILALALLLSSCSSAINPNKTSSDIPISPSSETISEPSSDMTSSDESVSSQKLEIPTRPSLMDGSHKDLYKEVGAYGDFFSPYYLNEENKITMSDFDLIIDYLVSGNFNNYRTFYLEPSTDYDGYNEICDNVYPVPNPFTLTYDDLVEYSKEIYVKKEAEQLINNPTYGEKRYHYFEKDGIFYIDQTVAKQENFIPYDVDSTYRYDVMYYKFDYKFINESTIQIEVFMVDLIDDKVVKLPLTAVKEDGEWKLEKMTLEKDVVGIE